MAYRKLQCNEEGSNTGKASCVYNPERFLGAIIVPKNTIIPIAELNKTEAELVTYITNLVFAAEKNNRWYPVKEFVSLTDGSEATVYVTKGYGKQQAARDGKYIFDFETDGGLCLSNALRSFNNKNFDVFFIDAGRKLIGNYNALGLKAIALDTFHADKQKVNDGANPAMFMARFILKDEKDLNENIDFYQFVDTDPIDEFTGLIDLSVVQITNASAATIKVQILEKCSKENIGEKYNGELDVVGAFVSNRTITGVAYEALTKSFVLTVATTWAAADTIALASPLALEALNVVGYESDILTVAATV